MFIALIIALPIGLLIIVSIHEFASYNTYGSYKSEARDVMNWLKNDLQVNPYNNDILSKFPDDSSIDYVAKTAKSVFGDWYVKYHSGECFRVYRWSELHDELEKVHKRAIEKRNLRRVEI